MTDPFDVAAARQRGAVVGGRKEGPLTRLLEGIGKGVYDAAAAPSRLVNAHMGEYQPGVSVQDMPQTMEQLPEVAMNVTGAPMMGGGVPGMGMGIRAYHGSPYDFERFSTNAVRPNGNMRGHGLYFSESPEHAAQFKLGHNGSKMYEVDINADPKKFLDWDKASREGMGGELYEELAIAHHNAMGQPASFGIAERAASERLKNEGVPGIKFKAKDGTQNYVVFDDKLIDILRKYGIAGMAGGAAASQSPLENLMSQ